MTETKLYVQFYKYITKVHQLFTISVVTKIETLYHDTFLGNFAVSRIAVFALSRDFEINMQHEESESPLVPHFGETCREEIKLL